MKLLLCISALVAATMAETSLEVKLKEANDQFTANMFQEVVKSQGDKSCVLSAFSVLSPLAQLTQASVGEAHDELQKYTGFSNDNETNAIFSDLNSRLRAIRGVELQQANKVYVRDGLELNTEFAELSRHVFNSEIQNIDFNAATKAANEINTWVEDHTNKRIKDLVDPQNLDPTTVAVLVNAIYFKGSWVKKFKTERTQDRDFYLTKEKKVTVPMMQQTGDFKYGESEELDAKLLEMYYEGQETSMVIALPNKVDGVNELIGKLSNPAALNNALNQMFSTEVQVSIPKFKIETTTNLKETLQKMNIKRLFSPGQARLEKLLKGVTDGVYVSSATQKAFIEVNEEGAEAAAANEFGISYLSAVISEPLTFNADHAFVFLLREKDNILFSGVFRS